MRAGPGGPARDVPTAPASMRAGPGGPARGVQPEQRRRELRRASMRAGPGGPARGGYAPDCRRALANHASMRAGPGGPARGRARPSRCCSSCRCFNEGRARRPGESPGRVRQPSPRGQRFNEGRARRPGERYPPASACCQRAIRPLFDRSSRAAPSGIATQPATAPPGAQTRASAAFERCRGFRYHRSGRAGAAVRQRSHGARSARMFGRGSRRRAPPFRPGRGRESPRGPRPA